MSKIVSPFAKIKFDIAEFDGNTNYGKFVVGPLERGYALTIGIKKSYAFFITRCFCICY